MLSRLSFSLMMSMVWRTSVMVLPPVQLALPLRKSNVAVFGVEDDYYGEEIMAWLIPRGSAHPTEEEIRTFLHERIAHFKIPRYIWLVEEFPMTVTGKVQKFRMREIAMARLQGGRNNLWKFL